MGIILSVPAERTVLKNFKRSLLTVLRRTLSLTIFGFRDRNSSSAAVDLNDRFGSRLNTPFSYTSVVVTLNRHGIGNRNNATTPIRPVRKRASCWRRNRLRAWLSTAKVEVTTWPSST